MNTPQYRESDHEPEGVGQMFRLLTQKPAPNISDPTTVAINLCGRIYFEAKHKMMRAQQTEPDLLLAVPLMIAAAEEARERTRKEIVIAKIRDNAIKQYDQMIATLSGKPQA